MKNKYKGKGIKAEIPQSKFMQTDIRGIPASIETMAVLGKLQEVIDTMSKVNKRTKKIHKHLHMVNTNVCENNEYLQQLIEDKCDHCALLDTYEGAEYDCSECHDCECSDNKEKEWDMMKEHCDKCDYRNEFHTYQETLKTLRNEIERLKHNNEVLKEELAKRFIIKDNDQFLGVDISDDNYKLISEIIGDHDYRIINTATYRDQKNGEFKMFIRYYSNDDVPEGEEIPECEVMIPLDILHDAATNLEMMLHSKAAYLKDKKKSEENKVSDDTNLI